tara:strand:+ start:1100 stop:2272 length:1173 start_codon:yes stop_codon:yes gene_type:complete
MKLKSKKKIHYSTQQIFNSDIKSVEKVLKSDYLTTGPFIQKFEKSISNYVKSKYAVGVNSATSGLHLACASLVITKGDIVWVAANSFVASANAAIYMGAKVEFIDINLETFNIDIDFLKKKILKTPKKNLPKALIVVHFAGYPCDLKEIKRISDKYRIKIIEDASHALGAKYMNRHIGDCKFSNITVFSFHPVKIITSAEGGIITTNNKNIYEKLMRLRNHGITRLKTHMKNKKKANWYYEQIDLGFNYRLSDIHAALGLSQLNHINGFLKKRNKIAKIYNKSLKNLPIILPKVKKNFYSSFHLYVILVQSKLIDRDTLYKKLIKRNIFTNFHYIPIYKHPFYRKTLKMNISLKNCETYYRKALSLPIHPRLTKKDIKLIIENLKNLIRK